MVIMAFIIGINSAQLIMKNEVRLEALCKDIFLISFGEMCLQPVLL